MPMLNFQIFQKKVSLLSNLIVLSIYPEISSSIFSSILPLVFTKADIPEFATLIKTAPFSTERKICAAKCCLGPVVFPNHASLVTLIIKFEFLD